MDDAGHRDTLAAAGSGDQAAVDGLLQQHLPQLVTWLRLNVGPELLARESCADLAQSVCREALEERDAFEDRGAAAFRSWLFQKALGKIRDRQRHWLAQKRDVRRELGASQAGEQVPTAFATASQVAIATERMEQLERAFAKLSPEQRELLSLSRVLGLSPTEIAARTGRTAGSVRVSLHRALARLGWLMNEGKGGGQD